MIYCTQSFGFAFICDWGNGNALHVCPKRKRNILDKQQLRQYHLKFILFLLIVALMAVCTLNFIGTTYRLPLFTGTDTYQETDWQFGEKGGEMSHTELSQKHWIEPGKVYELSTVLTYDGVGDAYSSAIITVGNYEFRVFLDDQLMFQYTKAERGYPRLKNMGGAAITLPLGDHPLGRELKLELWTSMDYGAERRMPEILLGDYAAHVERLFFQSVPSMLISLAVFFAAVILVLLGNTTPKKRWGYLFFSLFALLIVVYRSSQDLFLLYMWANPLASVTLEFFTLVFCPLPVLLSYRHELKPYFGKTFVALISLTVLNIVVQSALHFMGIRDVVENLEVTHIWIFVCAAALVAMAWRVRQLDPSIHCMRKMIPILIGACIDFMIFYVKINTIGPGSFFAIGDFIGLGVLTSLGMLVWEARKERERSFTEYQKNLLLEKMAYMDALTGIENRAAFTRAVDQIKAGAFGDCAVMAVEADLNDLKKTNDNLGHEAGDELIQRAANLLRDCFSSKGHVYRTGGDEFYALLYGVTEAQWPEMEKQFFAELQKRNEKSLLPLSIAMGHAFMDADIEKCLRQADKQMYIHKDRCKKEANYGFCRR